MRRHIPKEHKEIALRMSFLGLSDKMIQRYTGISERSMKRLCQTFRVTGVVERRPIDCGRPRLLDALDFLKGCLRRKPDATNEELLD
ncbi:hypothetical protein BDN72DRAFT_750054, partial [Pluteus cervinus]